MGDEAAFAASEAALAAEEAGFAASEAALEDIPVRDDFQGERDFDVESDFDRSTQEGDSQHGDLDDEMCAEDSGAAGAPREDPLPVADEVEAAVAEAFAEESVDDVVSAGVLEYETEDVCGRFGRASRRARGARAKRALAACF